MLTTEKIFVEVTKTVLPKYQVKIADNMNETCTVGKELCSLFYMHYLS